MVSRSVFFKRFIQTLKIRPKDRPYVVPFIFNEAQNVVWDRYIAPKLDAREQMRFIVLKARQLGISTLIQGLFSARFVWDKLVNEKVIAHEGGSTKNIWSMADRMIEHSPFHPYVRRVGTTMQLGDSQYSCSTAGSPHATRSMNITALHDSEVAFWPHPEAWLASMQTVPLKGESWVFVESTPNGKVGNGKLFYDQWGRASSGKSHRFTPIFLPWFILSEYELPNYVFAEDKPKDETGLLLLADLDTEERELRKMVEKVYNMPLRAGQLAWRRQCIEDNCQGDVDLFHQEYASTPEEAFIQSGMPLFSIRDILWFRQHIQDGKRFRLELDGRFVADPSGYVTIWKIPEVGHRYIIGADTSMGFSDGDHSRSAAEIIDVETMEQVGEYDCTSPTHVMARHLAVLGRRYNEALLAPEITASGGGGGRELLVYLLRDHHYYKIYRYKHVDHVKPDQGRMYGWETNCKTRPRMIARAIEAVKEKTALVHSEALLQQMQSFGENDSGRLEALAGCDDLFFAWSIAVTVRSEEYITINQEAKREMATVEDLRALGLHATPDQSLQWQLEWEERFQSHPGQMRERSWLEA